MKLGEKLRYLRMVEGLLRGLDREMSQQEVVRALRQQTGRGISQSYLSQLEGGARPHLTNSSRLLLASFFRVHPGYLVDDPDGFHTELTSNLRTVQHELSSWLSSGAEHFMPDPQLSRALQQVARHPEPRKCLLLCSAILETPKLMERLTEVLLPGTDAGLRGSPAHRKSDGTSQ